MNPRTEFADLLTRSRRLLDAALLLIITFGALLVAAGTLFCSCWITVFVFGRGIADRMTARTTTQKMEMLNVL